MGGSGVDKAAYGSIVGKEVPSESSIDESAK